MKIIKELCDKKAIKNGMYFQYKDKYYIKIGKRCAEMNIDSSILFEEIEAEEIEFIFNSNGNLKMVSWQKVNDDEEEEI